MDYTLHQLQIFLKVAQLQSITKASEALYLTQPAISIQLKKLQDQFEIPLTEIIGRKLYVTDFGKEIAIAAESILNEVHAINYKTLAYQGVMSGRLKIAVVSTGKYVIPYFLEQFLKEHQGIELSLDVTNRSGVVESLSKNEIDLALVSVMPEGLDLDGISLLPNKLFLVGSYHPILPVKKRELNILQSMPLIYREQGSGTRLTMEHFFKEAGLRTQKRFELTSNEAVKQAVMAGLGYSVMPLIGIRNELVQKQLQTIEVKGMPIVTQWNLIWLKDKKVSPVANAYIEHVKSEKKNIISRHFSWCDAY